MTNSGKSCCVPARPTEVAANPVPPSALSEQTAPAAPRTPKDPPLVVGDAAPLDLDYVSIPGAATHTGCKIAELPLDGEAPRRPVRVKPFEMAATTVTNSAFATFVADTGYATDAEKIGDAAVFSGLLAKPIPHAPTNPDLPWWQLVKGANWRHPEGPGSDLVSRDDHPVVHVSHADARAFCAWSGTRLPGEAEWEHAARGGLEDPRFPWGEEEPTDEKTFCNIWQGAFPHQNSEADGYYGTAPARSFQPNGYGLYNVMGNVWEWSADAFRVRSAARHARVRNETAAKTDEKLLKGGSFLCHISYCYRYRIAARHALASNSAASNLGFRVVRQGTRSAE